jgi:histidine ammonia-lyase
MVVLGSRVEITLEVFERVAWHGEPVRVEASALEAADAAREAFRRLIARPDVTVYGVTSGYGDRAGGRLDETERRQQARAAAFRAASFGEPLPTRVVRGIVLARLANLIGGHAAASGRLIEAVASLLEDDRPLPVVPEQGNGGSGEILALSHLFGPLIEAGDLGEKEGLALINGSPCGAALIADAAVAAERRMQLAYDVFALSIEAFQAPLDAYDEALESLWDDEHETAALRELRSRLDRDRDRRGHQGPVSYRILPRALGQAGRVTRAAAEVATVSLRSVTDNPVYLPPSDGFPDGRVLSTGGYHNATAPAALHQLAVCWADLCQLAERHVERLVFAPTADMSDSEEVFRLLLMVAVGYSEEARAAAQSVVLPRGGPGQNDVTSPSFLAAAHERSAGNALCAALAVLAAAACRRLDKSPPSGSPLAAVHEDCRAVTAALSDGKAVGRELEALAGRFRERVVASADGPGVGA